MKTVSKLGFFMGGTSAIRSAITLVPKALMGTVSAYIYERSAGETASEDKKAFWKAFGETLGGFSGRLSLAYLDFFHKEALGNLEKNITNVSRYFFNGGALTRAHQSLKASLGTATDSVLNVASGAFSAVAGSALGSLMGSASWGAALTNTGLRFVGQGAAHFEEVKQAPQVLETKEEERLKLGNLRGSRKLLSVENTRRLSIVDVDDIVAKTDSTECATEGVELSEEQYQAKVDLVMQNNTPLTSLTNQTLGFLSKSQLVSPTYLKTELETYFDSNSSLTAAEKMQVIIDVTEHYAPGEKILYEGYRTDGFCLDATTQEPLPPESPETPDVPYSTEETDVISTLGILMIIAGISSAGICSLIACNFVNINNTVSESRARELDSLMNKKAGRKSSLEVARVLLEEKTKAYRNLIPEEDRAEIMESITNWGFLSESFSDQLLKNAPEELRYLFNSGNKKAQTETIINEVSELAEKIVDGFNSAHAELRLIDSSELELFKFQLFKLLFTSPDIEEGESKNTIVRTLLRKQISRIDNTLASARNTYTKVPITVENRQWIKGLYATATQTTELNDGPIELSPEKIIKYVKTGKTEGTTTFSVNPDDLTLLFELIPEKPRTSRCSKQAIPFLYKEDGRIYIKKLNKEFYYKPRARLADPSKWRDFSKSDISHLYKELGDLFSNIDRKERKEDVNRLRLQLGLMGRKKAAAITDVVVDV